VPQRCCQRFVPGTYFQTVRCWHNADNRNTWDCPSWWIVGLSLSKSTCLLAIFRLKGMLLDHGNIGSSNLWVKIVTFGLGNSSVHCCILHCFIKNNVDHTPWIKHSTFPEIRKETSFCGFGLDCRDIRSQSTSIGPNHQKRRSQRSILLVVANDFRFQSPQSQQSQKDPAALLALRQMNNPIKCPVTLVSDCRRLVPHRPCEWPFFRIHNLV